MTKKVICVGLSLLLVDPAQAGLDNMDINGLEKGDSASVSRLVGNLSLVPLNLDSNEEKKQGLKDFFGFVPRVSYPNKDYVIGSVYVEIKENSETAAEIMNPPPRRRHGVSLSDKERAQFSLNMQSISTDEGDYSAAFKKENWLGAVQELVDRAKSEEFQNPLLSQYLLLSAAECAEQNQIQDPQAHQLIIQGFREGKYGFPQFEERAKEWEKRQTLYLPRS